MTEDISNNTPVSEQRRQRGTRKRNSIYTYEYSQSHWLFGGNANKNTEIPFETMEFEKLKSSFTVQWVDKDMERWQFSFVLVGMFTEDIAVEFSTIQQCEFWP